MSQNIDDYRCKLINKLLFAEPLHEVQTLIYTAIKELKEHKVHNYIIKKFLDKTIQSLQDFNHCDYNSQQWVNIKMSKIVLNRCKTTFPLVS